MAGSSMVRVFLLNIWQGNHTIKTCKTCRALLVRLSHLQIWRPRWFWEAQNWISLNTASLIPTVTAAQRIHTTSESLCQSTSVLPALWSATKDLKCLKQTPLYNVDHDTHCLKVFHPQILWWKHISRDLEGFIQRLSYLLRLQRALCLLRKSSQSSPVVLQRQGKPSNYPSEAVGDPNNKGVRLRTWIICKPCCSHGSQDKKKKRHSVAFRTWTGGTVNLLFLLSSSPSVFEIARNQTIYRCKQPRIPWPNSQLKSLTLFNL